MVCTTEDVWALYTRFLIVCILTMALYSMYRLFDNETCLKGAFLLPNKDGVVPGQSRWVIV